MSDVPPYVEHAFMAVNIITTEEDIERDMEAFVKRWGGVDPSTFAHVLQHAQGEDQIIAAFALGYTKSMWASELLLPYLQNDNPKLRWAVALTLGERREPEALPILIKMLQEYLMPPTSYSAEHDWFKVRQIAVATLLGNWGDTTAILPLREMLKRVWSLEQQHPDRNAQLWWTYQETLAYSLGQLDAFDALADLELPDFRRRYWMLYIALGYVNAKEQYGLTIMRILQEMLYEEKHQGLNKLLLHILQEKASLSPEEATSSIQAFEDDHAKIWYGAAY